MLRRAFLGLLAASRSEPLVAGLPGSVIDTRATPRSPVAVFLNDRLFLGSLGEKVAGGLFEILDGSGGFLGVFRLDEILDPKTLRGIGEDV